MPDMTMCPGEGCPKRDTCYRFTASPNPYRQSWFFETPWKDSVCHSYMNDSRAENQKKETNDKTSLV